jgi:3'(2'), 5'-bisphosphate nucleotidase
MSPSLDMLRDLLIAVAWEAGDLLRKYELQPELWENDIQGGQSPVTLADQSVDVLIRERLLGACGDQEFGYLTEETYKPGPPLAQPYVWVIDPLDGTKDFIQRTGEYAAHIALVHGGRPILAAVAWPGRDAIYMAQVGEGTYRLTRANAPYRLSVAKDQAWEDLRILTSRSHATPELEAFLNAMPQPGRKKMGSIGCKISAIAQQDADVYFMLPSRTSPKDWDLAGPELILTEAGGRLTHFDQSLLFYNRGDVNQAGGYLASNGPYHEKLCQMLQAASGED